MDNIHRKKTWERTIKAIERDIPGFKIQIKEESILFKIIEKCAFWSKGNEFVTTVYPTVWFPANWLATMPYEVLQHEWVHLKDMRTLFGLTPPNGFSVMLTNILYLFPQILGLLAFLGFWHWQFLFCLLFLLPIPAPFRAWAELRAYRRSIELGAQRELVLKFFTGPTYYFMHPWKKKMLQWLRLPSPYKNEMDNLIS